MTDTCETVVIKTENGPVIINKSDLTDKDVIYVEKPDTEKPDKTAKGKK